MRMPIHEFVKPVIYTEMTPGVRGGAGARLTAVRRESERLLDWYVEAVQHTRYPDVGRPPSTSFEEVEAGLRELIEEYEELYARGEVTSPRVRLGDLAARLGCSEDTIRRRLSERGWTFIKLRRHLSA